MGAVGDLGGYDWLAWLGLAIVLGGIEVTTLDLTFLMLSAGALAGVGVAVLGLPFVVQVLVALATAVAMLAAVRPVALRHLRTPAETRTGIAALVGAKAITLERVDNNGGSIKLMGEVWTARSYDPHTAIEAGTPVDVVKIDGATAIVYESEI
jgi:membrane protein implicated in regulation of membrane protease activity